MSMSDRDGVIWFDGEMVPWREAKTHVLTHTLHYGMGVFEGVRAYEAEGGTAIFRLQEHTNRLFDSAHIMNMKIPFSKEELNAAQRAAVRENNLPSAYIRPMVFYGSEAMGLRATGLKVHVIVAAWSWGAYMGKEALELGIKVRTSSYTRHHVNISMTRAKANGPYFNSMLALQEALSGGADEALLLDAQGYVAEGSGENIFVVKDGVTQPVFSYKDAIREHVYVESSVDSDRDGRKDRVNVDIIRPEETEHGLKVPVNKMMRDTVWAIAEGKKKPGIDLVREVYEATGPHGN